MNEKWDLRFLALAKYWADICSKDPSTRVGAAIVSDDRKTVILGYNGFPRGVQDIPERYGNRELKHKLVVHAEQNALDCAPCSVKGMTLYCTLCPCNKCAQSIIQKGIKRVVYLIDDYWQGKYLSGYANWEITFQMFEEASVSLSSYHESRIING